MGLVNLLVRNGTTSGSGISRRRRRRSMVTVVLVLLGQSCEHELERKRRKKSRKTYQKMERECVRKGVKCTLAHSHSTTNMI